MLLVARNSRPSLSLSLSHSHTQARRALANAQSEAYYGRLRDEVSRGQHLRTLTEVESLRAGVGVVWYSANTKNQWDFKEIARYFGVWHEVQRGTPEHATDTAPPHPHTYTHTHTPLLLL